MPSNINENSNTNKFTNPDVFLQNLNNYQQQFPHIIDDYKKYYLLYNYSPQNVEYQQMFNNIKGNLNNIGSQMFSLNNDVEVNTNKISNDLYELNKLIEQEKTLNYNLKKQLGVLNEKNDATTEMIDNYNQIYYFNYLKNWGVILSIILGGVLIYKVYDKKPNPSVLTPTTQLNK